MPQTDFQQLNVLKGPDFSKRLARICRALPEVRELPGIKYRRILIPGLVGGEIQFAQLAFVAHALRMRGAEPISLLCDEFLPACTLKKVDHVESACTRWCYKNIVPFIEAARLPHRWYSEFITPREKDECAEEAVSLPLKELKTHEFRGIPLGVHVDRSVESYFKVGAYDLDNPNMVAKGRQFLTSAMWLTIIGERALEQLRIEKVFMEDGEKTDWGVIRSVARHHGIPVDVVLGAPRGHSFLIEHDCYPKPNEQLPLWESWKDIPLTASQDAELDEYFDRRAAVPYDDQNWTRTAAIDDDSVIRREIGLPATTSGMIFAMFPNMSFDANLTTLTPSYDTAAEWVAETIRFFANHPGHHLIVKIHPSELLYGVLDPTLQYLAERFERLPPNIHVLAPDTGVRAIDVVRIVDLAMVYTSTVGVEAAYFGKPVINVGGGWHVNRGCSIDVKTPEQYMAALADICTSGKPPGASRELGRRYAYAVFFRSLLPIRFCRAMYPDLTALKLDNLDELAPGRDSTIDRVCDVVLFDAPCCGTEHVV